jgi:PIF1-like helicase
MDVAFSIMDCCSTLSSVAADGSCKVIIAAPTALAASVIDGNTIHNRFDIELVTLELRTDNSNLNQRLCGCKLIIVDAVSVVPSTLFTAMHRAIIRAIYLMPIPPSHSMIPLILVGDFKQLPPVTGEYAFSSEFWRLTHGIQLTKSMRQRSDEMYRSFLEDVANGQCTHADVQYMAEHRIEFNRTATAN